MTASKSKEEEWTDYHEPNDLPEPWPPAGVKRDYYLRLAWIGCEILMSVFIIVRLWQKRHNTLSVRKAYHGSV